MSSLVQVLSVALTKQGHLSDDEPDMWDLVLYTRPIQPGCEIELLKGVMNAA